MSDAAHIYLYNADEQFPLHGPFTKLDDVKLVAQSGVWADLKATLMNERVDVVAINMDSDDGFEVVKRITLISPGCGLIGISSKSDPVSIIKAMRAGCHQFVPWPIDVPDLEAALERIVVSRQASSIHSQRICVVGSSGGAGTTTIVCNLALELAQVVKRRCGVVDLNLELGDIGCVFECEPKFNIVDLCQDGVDVDTDMIGLGFHELPCNVSVLVRPDDLQQVRQVTPEGVSRMLSMAGKVFPFVVVDLPRSFSFISAAALRETDLVLIVTQLSVPGIRNATRIYRCLCEMGAPEESLQIVLNRTKANFQRIDPEDVANHFGRPVFAMIPNDYQHVSASRDHGYPVVADAPNSPARLAIQQLARRIAGQESAEESGNSRNFLRRFWKGRAPATPLPAPSPGQ
jgi:pilus assembly protein CpaE